MWYSAQVDQSDVDSWYRCRCFLRTQQGHGDGQADFEEEKITDRTYREKRSETTEVKFGNLVIIVENTIHHLNR